MYISVYYAVLLICVSTSPRISFSISGKKRLIKTNAITSLPPPQTFQFTAFAFADEQLQHIGEYTENIWKNPLVNDPSFYNKLYLAAWKKSHTELDKKKAAMCQTK